MTRFIVDWHDSGREPSSPPNPEYPNGIDLDLSKGSSICCTVPLGYPAKRCGQYLIACGMCGLKAMVTTAGRVDDPRSVKLACKQKTPSNKGTQ